MLPAHVSGSQIVFDAVVEGVLQLLQVSATPSNSPRAEQVGQPTHAASDCLSWLARDCLGWLAQAQACSLFAWRIAVALMLWAYCVDAAVDLKQNLQIKFCRMQTSTIPPGQGGGQGEVL